MITLEQMLNFCLLGNKKCSFFIPLYDIISGVSPSVDQFHCLVSSAGAPFQPRHHPKHRPSSGNRPRHPGALLHPREHEPPQRPLPRSQQEYGAQGLSRHVCGYLRLPIGSQRSMVEEGDEEM